MTTERVKSPGLLFLYRNLVFSIWANLRLGVLIKLVLIIAHIKEYVQFYSQGGYYLGWFAFTYLLKMEGILPHSGYSYGVLCIPVWNQFQ